ncbi:MAG: adenylate cyclase [Clostridia bacterium]|nr:adenylate cyclase [Clostridia bacterium]
MAKELEIEKKYKVKRLPQNLDKYEHKTIEQSYLNKGGAPIRLRKIIKGENVQWIFSKKARIAEGSFECIEHNIKLPENIYQELLNAKEGRTIIKTRYKITLQSGLNVELDVFHGFFEGVCIAEIEYKSVEQANNYRVPEWLGEEVTNLEKLANGYMAMQADSISDYEEFIPREINQD